MPVTLKKTAKAAAAAKLKATVTPARMRMAKETLRNVKKAVPPKQRKALIAGAKSLLSALKK